MASGLQSDPATFELTVVLTRWMFPYILLISLVALASGILNTWKRFAVPAFTPVLLNLAFIAAALLLSPYFDPPVYALAAGVMIGGVAQLALQVPALLRIGMLPKLGGNLRQALADAQVRRILRLMGPALLSVSVAQISLIVNTHIASRLATGSVSWVSFADRLMEFPTAMLGVALGTVLLPSLSRANAARRMDEYSDLLDWGLRWCALLALPCSSSVKKSERMTSERWPAACPARWVARQREARTARCRGPAHRHRHRFFPFHPGNPCRLVPAGGAGWQRPNGKDSGGEGVRATFGTKGA
jgi:putative peptidoglycan lipid II flippase